MSSDQWFVLRSAAALVSTTMIQMVVMAAVGLVFGVVMGKRRVRYVEGTMWGLACGTAWWLAESAIAYAFGISALAARLDPARLLAYLVYGVVLGVVVARLSQRV